MDGEKTYDGPRGRLIYFAAVAFVLVVAVVAGVTAVRHARRTRLLKQPLHLTGSEPSERISDEESYRLRIWGSVGNERSLTLAEVKSMPSVQVQEPLECVLGFVDLRPWRGVPLRDLLRPAEPKGAFITVRDDREFSASLEMDYVMSGEPILAWGIGDEPLPREHGWPLRVVAPGKYGYKWVKWVTEIEVHDRGHEGSYEEAGFSLDGTRGEGRTEWEKTQK